MTPSYSAITNKLEGKLGEAYDCVKIVGLLYCDRKYGQKTKSNFSTQIPCFVIFSL